MRSNGLTASSYTPIADVDPRIVGPLLDTLRQNGVAAYVTPVEPSSMPSFDRPEYRTEVRERLYVDSAAADAARELLRSVNAEIDTTGEDLAWAQIVSGWDRPLSGDTAPWPEAEELRAAEDDPEGHAGAVPGGRPDPAWRPDPARAPDQGRPPDPLDHGDHGDGHAGSGAHPVRVPEEDEDRFVPPPPPPLPRLEPRQQVAWLGVVGGPLLLLVSVLFSVRLPGWLSVLAVGGFVGGFVALVLMMGDDDDQDSGWDNGAVV
jgi:hypothetical protein